MAKKQNARSPSPKSKPQISVGAEVAQRLKRFTEALGDEKELSRIRLPSAHPKMLT